MDTLAWLLLGPPCGALLAALCGARGLAFTLFWVWVVILVGIFGSPFWALGLVVGGVFIALIAISAR
jgi:hypothetical protein